MDFPPWCLSVCQGEYRNAGESMAQRLTQRPFSVPNRRSFPEGSVV